MQPCDPLLIEAYFDGEVDIVTRRRIAAHLQACPCCADTLEALQATSSWLRSATSAHVSPRRIARIHKAIYAASDEPIWRLGATVGAIAASILVVAGTWLTALPTAPPRRPAPAAIAAAPAWEQVALTLRVEPLPEADQSMQVADAQFADWMLDVLQRGASDEKAAN